MDGVGNVPTGGMDVNDSGTIFQDTPLQGSYSLSNTGRGTAAISSSYATQNFVFYVVNATDFKFMETDRTTTAPIVLGEVLKQAPGPFTASSLKGQYAFTLAGIDGTNGFPLALGGLLPANGAGNIASGVLDVNDGGSASLGGAISGPYTVSSTGRGLATLTSSVVSFPLAFYPAANGALELVNVGGNLVVSGMAKAQSGGPFGVHSMAGNYAINFSGTNLGSSFSSAVEEDISGQLSGDGAGNLSGALDINNFGSIFQGVPLSASRYTMTPSGRGTASLNTSTGTFAMQSYQIDVNTVLFLDADANRVLVGIGQKQQF